MEYDIFVLLGLIEDLNKASYAYYNTDTPIMSDQEYDLKCEMLHDLEEKTGCIYSGSPNYSVGAPVLPGLTKVDITPKPMLSLDKCHDIAEIKSFIRNKEALAMIKLDGLSVRLKYNEGKLVSANTRGNGYQGTDITEHVKHFLNVPLTIPIWREYIVDGEAIIKYSDFELVNKNGEFKNPRNAAAGALNVLDMSFVKRRRLSFVVWDVIEGGSYKMLSKNLYEANSIGFEVVKYHAISSTTTIDDLSNINNALLSYDNYPCDGIVWKYDDIEYGKSLGATSHHFKNGIAWKPEVEVVDSELQNIDWTMGRTGVLTPVAVFTPVELDGSIVERASLHNLSVMENVLKNPVVGQNVRIFKANLIIPQILEADTAAEGEPIGIPQVCPICEAPTAISTSADGVKTLICTNPNCDGKLINQLDHFCGKKGLDIKGLSKATLEKLIDNEWISTPYDIYKLKDHKVAWAHMPGFGEKSVANILNAIEESRKCSLPNFISAIGIPLIGLNVAKEICKHIKTYAELLTLVDNQFDFSQWDGFGPEKSSSLLEYDYDRYATKLYYDFMNVEDVPEVSNTDLTLDGITVCVTGKLTEFKNRSELQAAIEAQGGHVSGSVSSKTNYLINNDTTSSSSKNLTAKKLGIPIVSEKEFIEKFLTPIKK